MSNAAKSDFNFCLESFKPMKKNLWLSIILYTLFKWDRDPYNGLL